MSCLARLPSCARRARSDVCAAARRSDAAAAPTLRTADTIAAPFKRDTDALGIAPPKPASRCRSPLDPEGVEGSPNLTSFLPPYCTARDYLELSGVLTP